MHTIWFRVKEKFLCERQILKHNKDKILDLRGVPNGILNFPNSITSQLYYFETNPNVNKKNIKPAFR
jgi:hypothetical protein